MKGWVDNDPNDDDKHYKDDQEDNHKNNHKEVQKKQHQAKKKLCEKKNLFDYLDINDIGAPTGKPLFECAHSPNREEMGMASLTPKHAHTTNSDFSLNQPY